MMRPRTRVWFILAAVLLLCAAVVAITVYRRHHAGDDLAALLKRLPADDAPVVCIDFARLRSAGILDLLAGSRIVQEPDYQQFVQRSGFDYEKDLDLALVSFQARGTFLLLKGRFDWKQLDDYVVQHEGTCHNTFCRMAGSTPARKISFFPLSPRVMAMAVSKDEWAADELKNPGAGALLSSPSDRPIWLRIPSSALKENELLPLPAKLLAKSMENSDGALLSIGATGNAIDLRAEIQCKTDAEAAQLKRQLQEATELLKSVVAQQKDKPGPGDVTTALTAGTFLQQARIVRGTWPIPRAFLEAIAAENP